LSYDRDVEHNYWLTWFEIMQTFYKEDYADVLQDSVGNLVMLTLLSQAGPGRSRPGTSDRHLGGTVD
jgi:hypothetical protein